jgi:hypothetical protein
MIHARGRSSRLVPTTACRAQAPFAGQIKDSTSVKATRPRRLLDAAARCAESERNQTCD